MTNISYNGVKEEDLLDRSFIFDIYILTTKNINPFSLERKIFDVKDREMINMFWEDDNEPSFYIHICQPDNFLYLNGKTVIYLRVTETVMSYIEADENNFGKLKRKLIKNQKIFQYVYASFYPEVYSFVEKRGVDMRNNFHLKFKEWKDRKKYSQKSTDEYFSKPQSSRPPKGAEQKKLVTDEDFDEAKKISEEQKKKEMGEKKTTKKRTQTRNYGKKLK